MMRDFQMKNGGVLVFLRKDLEGRKKNIRELLLKGFFGGE